MYTPSYTGQFKKDRKQAKKRNWDVAHLDRVVARLIAGKTLEPQYRGRPEKRPMPGVGIVLLAPVAEPDD